MALSPFGRRSYRGAKTPGEIRELRIAPTGIVGDLQIPPTAKSLVLFAHGSGSSRFSPRNVAVADALNASGIATLLVDLLTPDEEDNRANVFDIKLLAARLVDAVHRIDQEPDVAALSLGLFGASTGAAAALVAAGALGDRVHAIVSRGGRPDLAGAVLDRIRVPTLLIVGGNDAVVIELNERALARLLGPKMLEVVAGASHLFPEPGAMEAVIHHATNWFNRYLVPNQSAASRDSDRQY